METRDLNQVKNEFFKSIKKLITLENYETNKFHTLTTTTQFLVPESKRRAGFEKLTLFNAIVEKVWVNFNNDNQYSMHKIGDLSTFKNIDLLYLFLKAYMQQIELMVYNGTIDQKVGVNTMNLGDQFAQGDTYRSDFWYVEPMKLWKSIGFFGTPYQDTDEYFDLSSFATKQYVAEEISQAFEIILEWLDQLSESLISQLQAFVLDQDYVKQEDIDRTVQSEKTLALFQQVDEQDNPEGNIKILGRFDKLNIRGLAEPIITTDGNGRKTLNLDSIREVPGGASPVVQSPEETPSGDNKAISASWAFENEKAQQAKWDSFIATEYEYDDGTSEEPPTPELTHTSLTANAIIAVPPMAVETINFKDKNMVANAVERLWRNDITREKALEEIKDWYEYTKEQGPYLEDNIKAYKEKLDKEKGE